MRRIKKVIQLSLEAQLSVREIAGALDIPKSTVSDYLHHFQESGLSLSDLEEKDSETLYGLLFPKPPKKESTPRKVMPDFIRIHQELRRKHVTRLLLWEEYREAHPDSYSYTQFCELYNRFRKTLSISMRQVHRAGEKTFVDYSGLTMEFFDKESGEIREAEIFVAVLGASGYTFAEASCDQKKGSFIASHINAFEFFGGVSEILIPDNLKSGVTRADRYEPLLNESYQDMAAHYGAVVIPARPYTPKDKPKVELSVKLVQRWILARLRHRQFFSIEELNEAIRELLDSLNRRPMKKFAKSRYDLYLELDRPALKPLPAHPYRLRQFKVSRVNVEYHVEVEKSYYSVPYQLTGKEVDPLFREVGGNILQQQACCASQPPSSSWRLFDPESSHERRSPGLCQSNPCQSHRAGRPFWGKDKDPGD